MGNRRRFALLGIAVFACSFAASYGVISIARRTEPPLPISQATTAGMRWIPPGEFLMGSDDKDSLPNERPARPVTLKGFWIDEHDVTNAEFKKFIDATGYLTTAERTVDWEQLKRQVPPGTPKPPPEMLQPGSLVFTPLDHEVAYDNVTQWWRWVPGVSWKHPQGPQSTIVGKDNYPVVQVSWDDAAAYAAWAGKGLPTEAQWEYAARGGLASKRFVWGDTFQPDNKFLANTYTGQFPIKDTADDGFAGTSPVNAFPPNAYGLYDMAGNVWQWTSDIYSDTAIACAACAAPSHLASTEVRRVIKGGSFLCSYQYCESYRPSARRGTPRDTGSEHVGFRCVLSPP